MTSLKFCSIFYKSYYWKNSVFMPNKIYINLFSSNLFVWNDSIRVSTCKFLAVVTNEENCSIFPMQSYVSNSIKFNQFQYKSRIYEFQESSPEKRKCSRKWYRHQLRINRKLLDIFEKFAYEFK